MPTTVVVDVVVVGGGVLGLATTAELRRRGREVVCLERDVVGGDRAGSKGTSRIFRLAYEDPLYASMAARSGPLWRELEQSSGRRLLDQTGMVSTGDSLEAIGAAMRAAGAAPELIGPGEMRDRFPALRSDGPGLYEEGAGVLRAADVLEVLRQSCGDCVIEGAPAVSVVASGEAGSRRGLPRARADVEVVAGDVEYRARCAVLCGGAWSSGLLAAAGLGEIPVVPCLQQVAYFAHGDGNCAGTLPAFVDRGGLISYGLPDPVHGYKVGLHTPAPVESPTVDLAENLEEVAWLTALVERTLPSLEAVPVRTERCFYDCTPDEDFVVDRVGPVAVGAGTSGHGFKFALLLGRMLADLADGDVPEVPLDRFRLGRFKS